MEYVQDKLKEIFESTIESGLKYDGEITNIRYIDLFYKAASNQNLFKLMGSDTCMFNCNYKNKDAMLIVFYIPINAEDSGAKNIAERVMQIVEALEKCFVTLDFLKSMEIKEDKFIYITAVKCL
jgi:hypothetical protein